ncbi:MAG: short-chain dehydrogenase [Chloroflexi bacterium RBG_13_68_17]|nr:MAG: short-chain dehydrogenase [Chloroflexi bacterium RBG_13_68_17]
MKRVALVTGAAGGIGRATAEVFHDAGWETVAVDRQRATGFPEGVHVRQADVSLPDSVSELFAWLRTDVGRLDALVNNAAIQICKPLVETTPEEWDAVMASNLRSIFLTVRAGYPLLKAAAGAVVNVSSVHAVATSVDIAAYAASKGGALALTRAMALEFARDGVRVNVILPGAVDTPMLHAGLMRDHVAGGSVEERMAELGRRTLMGRVGKPEEIARAILFLADGQQSSFMTGQSMIVDGGATCRLSTE